MTKLLELDENQFFIYNHDLYLVIHLELRNDIIQWVEAAHIGVKRRGTSTPPSFHQQPFGKTFILRPEVLVELLT